MKITAKTKNIEVVPSICEGDDKFTLVFRYPSQLDLMQLAGISSNADIISFINSLFVEFKDKPELVDEDGKEIEYSDFAEMMGYGGQGLTSVMIDVVNRFKELGDDAGRLEKKS